MFVIRSTAAMVLALACAASPVRADQLRIEGTPHAELVERMRIGGLDARPEYAWARVGDAAVIGDDMVVIVDAGSGEIRAYDRDGTFVRRFGGRGDGPGEFRAPPQLGVLPDDQILAFDLAARRATIFNLDGTVARDFSIEGAREGGERVTLVGAFPNGSVALRVDRSPLTMRREPPGMRRDSIAILVHDAEDIAAGPWHFQGPERMQYQTADTWGADEPLFARHLVHAVVGRTLVVAHTDSLHFRRFVGSSETEAIRGHHRPRSPTVDEATRERQRRIDEAAQATTRPTLPSPFARRDADRRTARIERIQELPVHSTLPAFERLVGSDDGHLWIQSYPSPSDQVVVWHRLASDFASSWSIELPRDERLLTVSDAWIVTVVSGDYDEETVIVYEVRTPSSG